MDKRVIWKYHRYTKVLHAVYEYQFLFMAEIRKSNALMIGQLCKTLIKELLKPYYMGL